MTTINYPSPVTVNGYSCKNCTDVDYAKQHIDPAHPKDGPYGVDARTGSPAVTLGGRLADTAPPPAQARQAAAAQGSRLDVLA